MFLVSSCGNLDYFWKEADKERIHQLFQYTIELCQAHYKYSHETETLWFNVLDMVLQNQHEKILPLNEKQNFRDFARFYNSLVIELFEQVVKYVELDKLIEKLERSYGELKLGELKRSIINLLLNYENERALNQSVKKVVLEESYWITRGFIQCRQSSTIIRTCLCHFCKEFIPKNHSFLSFKCGHLLCVACQSAKFVGMTPVCVYCESFETSKGTQPINQPLMLGKMSVGFVAFI